MSRAEYIVEMAESEVYERLERLGVDTEEVSDTATVERLRDLFSLSVGQVADGEFTDSQLEEAIVWL